ncbi:hypothetical protein, partial [Actinacidiphila sp. bgisy160]|uniref:hypothetical protein n=1 Tax=Actinacidiphila sp. bgisy160 TaxID=3413796 RepID=UPI003D71EE6A
PPPGTSTPSGAPGPRRGLTIGGGRDTGAADAFARDVPLPPGRRSVHAVEATVGDHTSLERVPLVPAAS